MKIFLLILSVILVLSGCTRYSINTQKSGIFNLVEMNGNIVPSDGGILGAGCTFDFTKRYLGKNSFYGVKIVYMYSGSGFNVDEYKGVRLVLDQTEGFFIKYRKRHSYNVVTSTSGGGHWVSTGMGMGGGMMYVGGPAVTTTTTTVTIHGILTQKQLAAVLKAGSLEMQLIGPASGTNMPAKRIFIFSKENMKNLQKFNNEFIKTGQGA